MTEPADPAPAPARLIGGVFGLPDLGPAGSPLVAPDPVAALVNARSCIYVLARQLGPSRAWVPSYLCDAVITPLEAAGIPVEFYPVDGRLQLTDHAWIDAVAAGELVVQIDYFGFPTDPEVAHQVGRRGAVRLRDASQALLTPAGAEADFTVVSPRKFCGVPDGGLLYAASDRHLPPIVTEPVDRAWWYDTLRAVVGRRDFDRGDPDRSWFELFQRSEATAPTGAQAISGLAAALLERAFDPAALAHARRTNYLALADALADVALFPILPDDVVPLGFPVRVPDRDRHRQALAVAQIFPPVHWPIEGIVPSRFGACHQLAAEIMTLPCDQRLTVADMERQAAVLRASLDGT